MIYMLIRISIITVDTSELFMLSENYAIFRKIHELQIMIDMLCTCK